MLFVLWEIEGITTDTPGDVGQKGLACSQSFKTQKLLPDVSMPDSSPCISCHSCSIDNLINLLDFTCSMDADCHNGFCYERQCVCLDGHNYKRDCSVSGCK